MSNSTSEIHGNFNLVMQGNNNQVYQTVDANAFVQAIQDTLQKDRKKAIAILVLTAMPENVVENFADKALIQPQYQTTEMQYAHKHWRPYLQENPLYDLLHEHAKVLGIEVRIYFVECKEYSPSADFVLRLQRLRDNLICIVDVASLSWQPNFELAKELNTISIGGCLVPYPLAYSAEQNLHQYLQLKLQGSLGSLWLYTKEYARFFLDNADHGLVHIDLEVPDKHSLFQRLTAIIKLWFPFLGKGSKHLVMFAGKGEVPNSL